MKYSQDNNPKRQKFISERNQEAITAGAHSIQTLDELKLRLQQAILIEHFTIPPYLCALYSIKDGSNDIASRIIRTVVVEEMLHMVMVANILNAIGEGPKINDIVYIPKYPNPLPFCDFKYSVNLLKFSKEAINTFLRIEKPIVEDASSSDFKSIGQFYAAVRKAIIKLNNETEGGIFVGDPLKQITAEHYYGSGGKLVAVYNIDDALKAIDEIVGQGEGIDGTINDTDDEAFNDDVEFAHYFRFNEIFNERHYKWGDKPNLPPSGDSLSVDWNAVYNMEPNPKIDNYNNFPWLQEKMKAFNRTYWGLINNIHTACNNDPTILLKGIPIMLKLKEQAVELMKIPTGNGNYTAGPSFEYFSESTNQQDNDTNKH